MKKEIIVDNENNLEITLTKIIKAGESITIKNLTDKEIKILPSKTDTFSEVNDG